MAIQVNLKDLFCKEVKITKPHRERQCTDCGKKLEVGDKVYLYNGFSYTAEKCSRCHLITQL